MPVNSPLCWCESGDVETYLHSFFTCDRNREAAAAMMHCVRVYDGDVTPEKILTLEVKPEEIYMMATMAMITTGLETIWANRQLKKSTTVHMMRADLELAVSIRRRSRNRKIREAEDIIQNTLTNFF